MRTHAFASARLLAFPFLFLAPALSTALPRPGAPVPVSGSRVVTAVRVDETTALRLNGGLTEAAWESAKSGQPEKVKT